MLKSDHRGLSNSKVKFKWVVVVVVGGGGGWYEVILVTVRFKQESFFI